MSFPSAGRSDVAAVAPGLAQTPPIAAAVLAPPLAVFAPLGIAPLLALLAVLILVLEGRRAMAAFGPLLPFAALLALLSLWAAMTALWSPIPGHSLFESGRLLLLNAAGLVVLGAARAFGDAAARRLLRAALAGSALAILLLQVELRGGAPLAHLLDHIPAAQTVPVARYDRGVTVLLLAGWSGALGLAARGRWLWLALGGVIVGVTLFTFNSHASMLALIVGVAILPVAWAMPRVTAGGLAGGVLILALIGPLAAPDTAAIAALQRGHPDLQLSAVHRLVIWRFVSDRIAERPVLGWGMDASRAMPGGKMKARDYAPGVMLPEAAEVLPLHPHDAALQWRLELGLPGVLLTVAIIAFALWHLACDRAIDAWSRAIGLGFAGSALTIALLSFGTWQSWWLSALWLTAAIMAALKAPDRSGAQARTRASSCA